MKIGICEWNIPHPETAPRFEWAAQAGLKGLEIDLENAGGNEPRFRELSNHWKLELPTLGINACCKHSMCDPAQLGILKSTFESAVQTAAELNIPKLQVPSFCESFINSDADFEQTVECFRLLCKLAEGTGLIIGTENALSAEKQLELLNRVGSDQLKIYFDTRNAFAMSGLNSAEILEALYPHICEVHLKDGTDNGPSQPLGKGNSGFFQCLEILKTKNYTGWLLLENDYKTLSACQADIHTAKTGMKQAE
ncbi:sugar phosphate isomerase/epimerase [Pontiellaceae bacterium B12219]|nr:sugar phosphate isomerase/epimerase [Pontiellaceae bacterium B12219]